MALGHFDQKIFVNCLQDDILRHYVSFRRLPCGNETNHIPFTAYIITYLYFQPSRQEIIGKGNEIVDNLVPFTFDFNYIDRLYCS